MLSVLSSRPEPKPIRMGSAPNAKPTGVALHSMHSAGGYEHANYSRRNWQNIIEEVTKHAENLTITPVDTGIGVTPSPSSSGTNTALAGGVGVNKDSSSIGRPWPLLWD